MLQASTTLPELQACSHRTSVHASSDAAPRPVRRTSIRVSAAQTARSSPSRELLRSLVRQARKETIPWLQDLIAPVLAGAPEPLTDTVSPRELADSDSHFLEVDGVTLHYKDTGAVADASQPAVLLLHGLNGSVFSWRNALEALSKAGKKGCRVIAVDRPPFGLSQRPLDWDKNDVNPYTAEGNAKLALGLLRQLGIMSAIPVGHSQGALVAMEMYKREPDSISGLVLVAPALPGTKSDSSWTRKAGLGRQLQLLYTRAILNTDGPGLQYVRRQIRQRADEVKKGGKLGVFADETVTTEALIEGYLRPMRAHDWDKGSLYSFRSMNFPSSMPYSTIVPPVLIVAGEKDRMLTRSAQQIAEVLKKRPHTTTEYVEFPNCGHVPMDEQPDEFIAAVLPFLTKVLQKGQMGNASSADVEAQSLLDAPDQPVQAAELTTPEYDAIPVQSGI